MVGIYKITNLINQKSYIGQSINISRRIKDHFQKAECPSDVSYNGALHSAIRKYGKNNFVWEVLEECSPEELDSKEQYYIQKFNTYSPNGYNILEGGQKIRSFPRYCEMCGKIKLDKSTRLCPECGHKIQRVVERPTREELKAKIKTQSFLSIGKEYGVSDNAIRKWCKAYNLPFKKTEINKISDEDWKDI